MIEVSPIHKQIKSVTILNTDEKLKNETGERLLFLALGMCLY